MAIFRINENIRDQVAFCRAAGFGRCTGETDLVLGLRHHHRSIVRPEGVSTATWCDLVPATLSRGGSWAGRVHRFILCLLETAMEDNFSPVNLGILFERVEDPGFPPGYFYAHVPSLGLTTNGVGIEGVRAAATDLARLWVSGRAAHGERVASPEPWFRASSSVGTTCL